ncbi:MAG: hypothetical protein ACOZHQ_12830 [Thermodesulfobacteriota bacterium]
MDVLEDPKRVAPRKGVTGYQGLIKLYIVGMLIGFDLALLRRDGLAARHGANPHACNRASSAHFMSAKTAVGK